MIKAKLQAADSNEYLHSHKRFGYNILTTTTHQREAGTFASASRSTAGTSIIATPSLGGAIVLTDLIWGTDKVQFATITIQWNDDVRTITIFSTDVSDFPSTGAIAFQGNWQGWENARLELVTVNSVTATVSCGYFKAKSDYSYDWETWDGRR